MHSGKMCMNKFHWHKTRIQNLPRLGHLDLALSSIGKSILRGSLFFHRVDRGLPLCFCVPCRLLCVVPYDSMSDLGEIRVYQRADFQSGSRVLKKVF